MVDENDQTVEDYFDELLRFDVPGLTKRTARDHAATYLTENTKKPRQLGMVWLPSPVTKLSYEVCKRMGYLANSTNRLLIQTEA